MKSRRILSLDGGGMKGLFSAYLMKQFCEDAGIPIRNEDGTLNPDGDYSDINQYFDIIAGSSIGGIAALAYASGYSPGYLIKFFKEYGPEIFKYVVGGIGPTYRPMPSWAKNAFFATLTFSAGSSLYGTGTFGEDPNSILLAQLNKAFGDTKIGQLKVNTLITSIEYALNEQTGKFNFRPVLFSNLKLPGFEGQNYKLVDVALATGAAPIYFPPITIEGSPSGVKYLDGGVYQNNPSALELALSNVLEQGVNTRTCVLSIGCGLGTVGFYDPNAPQPGTAPNAALSNIDYLVDLIGVASTGAQEAINRQLQWLSRFNRNLFYFRFQTIFDPNINTELDNSGPDFNAYMEFAADNQYALDKQKILAFIQNAGF